MKITIKQLKQLIREAIYQGPDVPVTMQTSPDYEMMYKRTGNRYPGRFYSEVTTLMLDAPGLDRGFSRLAFYKLCLNQLVILKF